MAWPAKNQKECIRLLTEITFRNTEKGAGDKLPAAWMCSLFKGFTPAVKHLSLPKIARLTFTGFQFFVVEYLKQHQGICIA
ncbi:MAG TPA: hypothetical protein VGN63_12265 [Flavisolibacter sp.]|nr:hypothetical protein [Flavisolibacter sp.]